jgi:hypothetical protein
VLVQSADTVCACRGSRLTIQGVGQQEQEACMVGRGGGGLLVCVGVLWLLLSLPVLVGYVVLRGGPAWLRVLLLPRTHRHAGTAPGLGQGRGMEGRGHGQQRGDEQSG